MENIVKPIFNKRIFGDVVFDMIDYDAKAHFVIERVLVQEHLERYRKVMNILS
jgi:hypothetical protein